MAEGIFRSVVSKPPYQGLISLVDSCGTGAYHTGSSPDSRTMATLEENGITDYDHAARKVTGKNSGYGQELMMSTQIHASDFQTFDFVFAMDRDNLRDLQRIHQRAGGKATVKLFGEYSGKKRAEEVDDPYYGGRDGFEEAYQQLSRFTRNFLKETFPNVEL
jgi:low molecular weight phosphotyrosine protein phosphatase